MQASTVPLACFLSLIRPPGIQFENALLQIAPVNKGKCPFVRDNNDVVFQLYTRHNPTVAHSLLIDDDERLFASSIDFNDNTVIYFHAFMETPDDGSALLVREAYTHRGDTNVIVVDAQRLEAGPWYFKAAENTWYIGRIGAQFIDYLVSRGLKLSKTHLVGHSLGAQSAGVAGGTLQSGRVSRITGLDPALPLFDKLPLQQRLDPSDAEFVDVIHTDAGIFGYKQQIGHVDFYPNGGISPQPGCELEVVVPKQMVLNKCNKNTKLNGYLEFNLQETNEKEGHVNARNKLHNLETNMRTVKKTLKLIKGLRKQINIKVISKLHTKKTNITAEVMRRSKSFKHNKLSKRSENITHNPTFMNLKLSKMFNFKGFKTTSVSITKMPSSHRRHSLILMKKPKIIKNKKVLELRKTKPNNKNEATTKTVFFETKNALSTNKLRSKREVNHRQRRFIPFMKLPETSNDNMLFRILGFLLKHHKKIVPTLTTIKEIYTIIKTTNGELQNVITEQNNYTGTQPGEVQSISSTYNLDIGKESKFKTFLRKILGLRQDRLVITSC